MRDDTALIPCAGCRTTNRIRLSKIALGPKCGKCGARLDIPRRPVDVKTAGFEREVLGWPGLVLVEFYTRWCGHCQAMAPGIEDLARQRAGRLKTVRIDADDEPALAGRFGIKGTPTFVLYRNGRKIEELAGAVPISQLEAWIDRAGA